MTIRPGVTFPDWSVIDREAAHAALAAIIGAFGNEMRWADHGDREDRLLRSILELYARDGRAPSTAQLATSLGMTSKDVRALLSILAARDVIVLDDRDGTLTGAYPFTERSTGHRVNLGRRTLNAMCAIDALGAGAMVRRDSRIDSSCRDCGAAIHIETRVRGTASYQWSLILTHFTGSWVPLARRGLRRGAPHHKRPATT